MTILRHSTIVLDPLNSGSKVWLNPGQGRADDSKWTRQPTQKDVKINTVECRTEVKHSKQGDQTMISCPENVGWDLEEGRFGWVTPPVCRLVLRHTIYDKQQIKTSWANERIEDEGYGMNNEWQTGRIKVPRGQSSRMKLAKEDRNEEEGEFSAACGIEKKTICALMIILMAL